MSRPMVVAREYTSAIEAQLAKGLLQASGIEAIVFADDCGSWHPELQVGVGVRLLVPQEQEAEAVRILDDLPND